MKLGMEWNRKTGTASSFMRFPPYFCFQFDQQVAQLSQRDRATNELLRFAKLRSGIFKPPFWVLRGNIDASCVRRWKKRSRLPIGDN